MLRESAWITGSQDGSIALWDRTKRKPLAYFKNAHGGLWVSSVGACRFSDLGASGSADGFLKLWQCNLKAKEITLANQIPIVSITNNENG